MASLSFKVLGAIGLASYAAAYLCARLRHVSYHRFALVAVPAAGLPDMPRGYTHRMLTPGELALHVIDVDAKVQAQRFAAGMECLAVFDRRGELAGVSWLTRKIHREGDLYIRFVLPENAAWDTGLWVPQAKRMGRAFSAVWAATRQWLEREGLDWTISSIADYNIPSMLSHRRLGGKTLGHVMVLSVGRYQLTLGAWPFLSVKSGTSMPTMRLRPV